MIKILGTGLSGLVGSRVTELLSDDFEFESSDVDIRNKAEISKTIKNSVASLVLHFAAKTDVDSCENDKASGKNGDAWIINVVGTQNVAVACEESNKKMIYVSTDFVFDGESESPYKEEDKPNPMNWYGRTKYEGEIVVTDLLQSWTIVRLAYPYRVSFDKLDFSRAIIIKLSRGEKVQAVSDHIFTPTFIDDFAAALILLIKNNAQGIYHVVGSQFLTPYEAATLICEKLGFNKLQVTGVLRGEYFKNRAMRPASLALSNYKIRELGVRMRTFEEGLDEFARFGTIGNQA